MLRGFKRVFMSSRRHRYHYASVNGDAVCTAVWRFDEPRENDRLVRIDSLDSSLIDKRWNGRTWESVPVA